MKKKRFRELICHPKYGLCVYIVMDKFILLRSDDIDLEFSWKTSINYLLLSLQLQKIV